jgi:2-polyprenyl-3-methyl-5-hydroxy-6-metoxy-1,4-benzoquinol methylase
VPSRLVYDLLYRVGAARRSRGWDKGVGPELRGLVESRLTPSKLGGDRAIDLGCGTGANSLFLAEQGFTVTGVDFARAAVQRATADAEAAGLAERARFLVADVTADRIDGAEGPFDLVVVYNTLQDLRGEDRRRMARLVGRLCRPTGKGVVWCYFRPVASLPLISFRGPSRLAPFVVEPGEEHALFGGDFEIERLAEPSEDSGFACLVLTRR